MMMPLRKNSPLIKIIINALIDLPTPTNISTLWNFGSLLGICLVMQILTGIFFAMHYCRDINYAFNTVSHNCRDINYGWLIRNFQANGASLFFICLYIQVGRGLYSSSFKLLETWTMGVLILLMTLATALLGYVLSWSQMSFWGATVITYLMYAIPHISNSIVYWLWGGLP